MITLESQPLSGTRFTCLASYNLTKQLNDIFTSVGQYHGHVRLYFVFIFACVYFCIAQVFLFLFTLALGMYSYMAACNACDHLPLSRCSLSVTSPMPRTLKVVMTEKHRWSLMIFSMFGYWYGFSCATFLCDSVRSPWLCVECRYGARCSCSRSDCRKGSDSFA